MAAAIETFSDDVQRIGLELISGGNRMQQSLLEHEEIVRILDRGEFEAARAAMIEHLEKTKNYLLAALAEKSVRVTPSLPGLTNLQNVEF